MRLSSRPEWLPPRRISCMDTTQECGVAKAHPKLEALTSARPAGVEAAWLAGDCERARQEAERALVASYGSENPWWMGELRCLLHRIGLSKEASGPAAEPYRLEI